MPGKEGDRKVHSQGFGLLPRSKEKSSKALPQWWERPSAVGWADWEQMDAGEKGERHPEEEREKWCVFMKGLGHGLHGI